MEEKIEIIKARVAFGSFVKLGALMGLCTGVFVALMEIIQIIINILNPSEDFNSGIVQILVGLIFSPLGGAIMGLFHTPSIN